MTYTPIRSLIFDFSFGHEQRDSQSASIRLQRWIGVRRREVFHISVMTFPASHESTMTVSSKHPAPRYDRRPWPGVSLWIPDVGARPDRSLPKYGTAARGENIGIHAQGVLRGTDHHRYFSHRHRAQQALQRTLVQCRQPYPYEHVLPIEQALVLEPGRWLPLRPESHCRDCCRCCRRRPDSMWSSPTPFGQRSGPLAGSLVDASGA